MNTDRSSAARIGNAVRIAQMRKQAAYLRATYATNPNRCEKCAKPIAYIYRNMHRFCSRSCAMKVINIGLVRHGKPTVRCSRCNCRVRARSDICANCAVLTRLENGGGASPYIIRRWLIKVRGCKCERCNGDSWLGKPMPVEVHHVDGNFTNNSIANLELLCPNCHSITPTYRAKNKGHGRGSRREQTQHPHARPNHAPVVQGMGAGLRNRSMQVRVLPGVPA